MNKRALKSVPVLTAFSVSLVIMIALRGIIIKLYVEEGTGFYVGAGALVSVFNILLAALVVCFVAAMFNFVGKKQVDIKPQGKAMGIAFIIAALGFFAEVFYCKDIFMSSKASDHLSSLFSGVKIYAEDAVSDIFAGYVMLASAVFAFLSFAYFLILGIGNLVGRADRYKIKLSGLLPLWWAILKCVYFLLVPLDIKRSSDILYEAVTMLFLLLFFSAFARIVSGYGSESAGKKAVAYAMCAALFSGISSASRLIAGIAGYSGFTYTSVQDEKEIIFNSSNYICILAIFILCTVFTFYAVRRISSGRAETAQADESAESDAPSEFSENE